MSITVENNRIIFERRDELTVLEPYGPNCIRCRSTKNCKLSEENWTLLPAKEGAEVTVESDGNKATLINGMMSVTVDAGNPWYGGIITFYRDGVSILRTKFEGDYTCRNLHTDTGLSLRHNGIVETCYIDAFLLHFRCENL